MLTIRRSADRGHANHGWLDSHHSFSFADYYAPTHMGFRALRVVNEDRVQPGRGFGTHGHRDMEILSYVLDGALSHRDSMGTGSVIRPGDLQRMSAGTGVQHCEQNDSRDELVHFLQIWIVPRAPGGAPGYEQKHFALADRRAKLRLLASEDGADGSITVRADARLYASVLEPGESVTHVVKPSRHAWIQVARGEVNVDGQRLAEGDGASTSDAGAIVLSATASCEVLVFDLA